LLEVDRERHELLLHARVQVALDPAPVGIGGQDQPFSRRAQLLDLQAEPIERFPQCFNLSSVQGERPPAGASGKLFVIAPWVKWSSIPCNGMAASRRVRLPPP
jgi:hypothetical protein